MDGIGLVPDPVRSQPTDVWHVALNGRARKGFPHITTTVSFSAPTTSTPTPFPTSTVPPVTTQPSSGGVAVGPVNLPGLGQPSDVAPQVAPTPAPTAVAAQPVAYAHRVHTSMAYIAPLLLLAAAIYLGRLFTRDATPVRLP